MNKNSSFFAIAMLMLIFVAGCRKDSKHNYDGTYDTQVSKLYIEMTEEGNTKWNIKKDDYLKVRVSFFPFSPEFGDTMRDLPGKIKGRGNSTWNFLKKPYKLKMDEKTGFYNRGAEKDWVLLANYADKTLMRNYLAFHLAEKMGMPFTPSYHFVDVYINGGYEGNYMMTDQMEMKKTRVNLKKLEHGDNDSDKITGGYFLEVDGRAPESGDIFFRATKFPIRVRYPEEPSSEQMNYISGYVKKFEQVLYSAQFRDPDIGFRKYMDEESMIKWFIINELFKNSDVDFGSMFMYKDRNDKLHMGPVWDFDHTAGNSNQCKTCLDPSGWRVRNGYWIKRMTEDSVFNQNLKATWNQYKSLFDQLQNEIDIMAWKLKYSQKENFKLWTDFNDPLFITVQGYNSYDKHVNYMKDWLSKRISWMDNAINEL